MRDFACRRRSRSCPVSAPRTATHGPDVRNKTTPRNTLRVIDPLPVARQRLCQSLGNKMIHRLHYMDSTPTCQAARFARPGTTTGGPRCAGATRPFDVAAHVIAVSTHSAGLCPPRDQGRRPARHRPSRGSLRPVATIVPDRSTGTVPIAGRSPLLRRAAGVRDSCDCGSRVIPSAARDPAPNGTSDSVDRQDPSLRSG